MRRIVTEVFNASNLDDEQLQIAIRVAHNNLKDRKMNFDEFVKEARSRSSDSIFLFAFCICQYDSKGFRR